MDMSHHFALFVFLVLFVKFCDATIFSKVNDYTAIVANGKADVQLEEDMIGIRLLSGSTCKLLTLEFQDQNDSITPLGIVFHGSKMTVLAKSVSFDGANSLDIFVASNGSIHCGKQLLTNSLEPLKVDPQKRVHFTVTGITSGCYVPIVKGKVNDDQLGEKKAGGFPIWAIVIIIIVVVVFIIGLILLAVFRRRLPWLKRRSAAAQEQKPPVEVKIDAKQPDLKPQSEAQPKESKPAQPLLTAPPPPIQPAPVLPPKPTPSAPPTGTETTPTPSAVAAPPRTDPPPSEEPPAAPPSATPPPPSTAPPTSDEPAPRFTARGARVHKSVPQRLLDNPTTKTASRSSERRKRILRKNSLEVGNRPPGYTPPPFSFRKAKVPTPPTEQPGTSAETGKKKECCPEKEPPVPTPAEYRELPPTKRLPQTEYMNWTPSEGSPHPSQETKDRISTEDGRKKASTREPAKDAKPETKVDASKPKSADGKPTTSKPKQTSSNKKKSSEDKAVNNAVDDEDDRK